MNVVYAHNENEGRKVAALFASRPGTAEKPITRIAFKDSIMDFSELGSGKALPGVCDVNLKNTLYTASTPTLFDVTAIKSAYESYRSFVARHPSTNRSILLFEAASGKAINAYPHDYTAYPHRGRMTTNAIIQATWDEDHDGDVANAANTWGKSTRDMLAREEVSGYDKLYAYVNYANSDEPAGALYGYDQKHQRRLTELKNAYDPQGFFNAYRPVPSEMDGWFVPVVPDVHVDTRDEL